MIYFIILNYNNIKKKYIYIYIYIYYIILIYIAFKACNDRHNPQFFFDQSLRKFFICVHIWPTRGQKQNTLVNISTLLNVTSFKKKYPSPFCSLRKLPYCPYILLMTTLHLTIYPAKKLHHSHEVVVAAFVGCDPL